MPLKRARGHELPWQKEEGARARRGCGGWGVGVHVRALEANSALDHLHDLLHVALLLVVADQVFKLVRLDDDVDGALLRDAELLLVDGGLANVAPRLDGVRLASRVDGASEVVELAQCGDQAAEVAHVVEHDLGSLVQLFGVAPLAQRAHVRNVRAHDELLQVHELPGLAVGVHELRVDHRILHLLARHRQVRDKGLVRILTLRRSDHLMERRGVVALGKGLDGLRDHAFVELGPREQRPHRRVVALGGKRRRARHVFHVLDHDLHGLLALGGLLVEGDGLLQQPALGAGARHGDRVDVVELGDIVLHPFLVGLDSGHDQQGLEVLLALELARLQDDLVQQLDQIVRQVGIQEHLHAQGHLVGLLAFGQDLADEVVDEFSALLRVFLQHASPQVLVHAVHQILGLLLEHRVR